MRLFAWHPPLPGLLASREGGELPVSDGPHTPACSPSQELMEVVHLHLVKEYIIRLSKRSLVLKVVEQQRQLAEHILANAEVIQRFCTQNVSSCLPLPSPTGARATSGPLQTQWVLI